MSKCKHMKLEVISRQSWGEPPYDPTDFTWEVICRKCLQSFAEGDGYSDGRAAMARVKDELKALEDKE